MIKLINCLTLLLLLNFTNAQQQKQASLPNLESPRLTMIPILISLALTIIGLIFTFIGKRIIKILLSVLGFFLFIFICFWISNSIVDLGNLSVGQKVGIIIGSLIAGILGGISSWYLYKVGVAILGFLIGFQIGGFLVQNLVQSRITLIIIMVICGIVFATLAIFLNHTVIVILTSFGGGILVFIGIDVVANKGLLDLLNITNSRKSPTMNASIWAMLVFAFILGVIGASVQFRAYERYKKWRKERKLKSKSKEEERLIN